MSEDSNIGGLDLRGACRALLPLGAVMALALALRMYRLGEQSAWIDEFQLAGNLDAPSMATYIQLLRFRGRDGFPFYYIIFYYWNWLGACFGVDGPYFLRLLALLCNMASIPLLYVLTRSFFGRAAAGLAVLCFALSPTQIWYAQSIHVTAFWQLLALVSIFGLHRAVCTRRPGWWLLVSTANLMMVWTQPFAVFLVGIEGVYILWRLRPHFREAVAWTGLQFLLCLSIFAWMWRAFRDVQKPEEDFTYLLPSLKSFLADWLADDAVISNDPFVFQGQTWGFLSSRAQQVVVDAHAWIDWALIAFSGLCIAYCAGMVVHALWKGGHDRFRTPGAAHGAALILAVALCPVWIHLLVTVAWRPIILPRFTSYSALAVYAAVAGGIAFLPWRTLRKSAIGLLMFFYAYQLSLALPAAQRTDYGAAVRHIAAEARPDDTVLVAGTFISWEAFRYNAGNLPFEILPACSLDAASDKAARLLAANGHAVWVVIEPFVFTLPPLEQFEQNLAAHGLSWSRRLFPGMNGLYLYRIASAPEGGTTPRAAPVEIVAVTDYAHILRDLGYDTHDPVAERALREAWDVEFVPTTFYYSMLALHLAAEGHLETARRAADRAIALDEQLAFSRFVRTVILGESGEEKAAQAEFNQALALDWIGYVRLYGPLFAALYWEKDPAQARARIGELDRFHVFMPYVCYVRAGTMKAVPPLSASR
ncbi:MAG TPA: glycosyltransferase family 39 protein [Candidatus Hydrogenedentes bacterium]|nr:glycosyltransferase family 39 protein [Candidatus Hydrogenedentota bacterium]HRT21011.1 glycosyltransferase family 39 protein [Candidatus Hydrogenedentota bacterium]HRT65840.1 glycosyltransferase family 39 protein [Candidatus Hydrogenedentota bacterium]